MKYLYYPGCSLKSTGRPYDESLRAVFAALGIELTELDDWNCCGATAYASIDENQAFGLAARNLAIAEAAVTDGPPTIVAPCSACFLVLTKTQRYFEDYDHVRDGVTRELAAAGLTYRGHVKVRHPLDILIHDVGLPAIAKLVQHQMKGLHVASYYGCQVVRPFATFDDPLYPTSMDAIMRSLGAETVDWPLKTRCCGGSLSGTIKEAGLRLNQHLLVEALRKGSDLVVTCCPLCQFNLECFQKQINKNYDERISLPIMYFTQLMGLAFGIPEKELGIRRLFIDPLPVIGALKGGVPAHV
ncbi:MAG TPA: CoB--CoM heterodisulfide reductase iron-sulfur subunit B family protein [Bacteroidota bacterium]|nr:CoB--CoM heterodisulfide reductase iron-sulfur subunit B family protein [Bacteroidota bacterium]